MFIVIVWLRLVKAIVEVVVENGDRTDPQNALLLLLVMLIPLEDLFKQDLLLFFGRGHSAHESVVSARGRGVSKVGGDSFLRHVLGTEEVEGQAGGEFFEPVGFAVHLLFG
jgi:hypothetical protein